MDLNAIPAALLPALSGKRVRGGSTLTQQLAKLLFLGPERSLSRKVREVLLAVRIERTYTKREILEFYLNQVYLGAGAYGFTAAAERYFSLPLDSLDLSRQALLAGLMQRPEALRPDRFPEARSRGGTRCCGPWPTAPSPGPSIPPWTCPWSAHEVLRAGFRRRGRLFRGDGAQGDGRALGKGFLDSAGARIHTTLDSRAQELVDSSSRRIWPPSRNA